MQPTSTASENIETNTEPNGYTKPVDQINSKSSSEEKVVLPVEMASMVSLRALIGKLVHKSHADLMTLTDTLPSMSDVEKKRQILTYTTFVRKQFLKLLVLVKWATNANDIQMCQNIMAFLANQNKVFQDTVDYLHKIHIELPAARLRNFDIPTAVDVLTTGTYQRMPTKIKDMLTTTPLTDEEVLETFQNMNDVIRMRMITSEVLPSPMQKYRIENGRIYFSIENEFEVALTLMGHSSDRRWWIVSLDVFVQATSTGGAAEDVDITLNDMQKQHLRVNAQKQLVPPILPVNEESSADTPPPKNPLFFPLVNMYDYLHLCCLNMQLEILFIQAAMLAKTRWINQLKVQMNGDRTKLTLVYWRGGSPASHWARPNITNTNALKSTVIEISIDHHAATAQENLHLTIRDELKGLIQKAGIGASVALSQLSSQDKPKVLSSLKYPKDCLNVLWDDSLDLHTEKKLLETSDLNIEQLVLHVTNYHGKCIIEKFRTLLISQKDFLEENGLHLAEEGDIDGLLFGSQSTLTEKDSASQKPPSLVVRYRHQRYVSIESDARTGRVKAFEASDGCSEGDFKLRGLEDRLNNDPENIARHLLWLRSEVVVREVISLAKQLNVQPYHPSQMNLRPDDISKLFDDFTSSAAPGTASKYPSHCVFLQFSQFEDWYLVIATIKNEFKLWLCCINKTFDQNGLYQAIVDLTFLDCKQLWKDQFISMEQKLSPVKKESSYSIESSNNEKKRRSEDSSLFEDKTLIDDDLNPRELKRRKSSIQSDEVINEFENNKVDNLSIDLRYLAKLDSLCRAFITNRKIELQLQHYQGSLRYHMRPLLQSLSSMETQILNHPAADKMEVVCVPQRDLLRTCAYHFAEDGTKRDKPLDSDPWIEQLLPHMKNDVLIRSFGWWDCGRGDCYVVIQDKFDSKHVETLQTNDLGDHIALDKATGVVSFTYPNIDNCINQFLMDWERIFMMANLTRQVLSVWFEKYKEQLEFNPTDFQELSFSYAKDFTCTIKWDSPSKGHARRYNIELGLVDEATKTTITALPSINSRNPHWRIASFLRDVLNESRDLIYFVQVLFQTLPLMACLERLEVKCAQEGDIGKVSIIPRAYNSVRVIFSTMHAIDIRFADKSTICVSDAAYHHLFYSSTATKNDPFVVPQPFVIQQHQQQQHDTNPHALKPIKVAQQFNFRPFDQFSGLLDTLDTWIFSSLPQEEEQEQDRWYTSGEMWADQITEPSAVSFQHGLLCSASLCQGILNKLQAMV